MADSGYDGAGQGIKVPFTQPRGGQVLATDNQANNSCTAPPAAAANAASPCSPAIMGPRPRDDVIAASGARLPRAAPVRAFGQSIRPTRYGAGGTRFEVLMRWRVSIRRTAPERDRMDSEWVMARSAE